ncbi:polyphosphate kinase 2 [Bowmanella dokdonensis]|uniref:ADP/GDP-polyphosphate phosphotransferase n=1 Tax=Bowmanella dokdonensis TaxID=751969 RepID=A0A939DLG5_9ALTE|nr:polyphosphate kinase 2 [Bowmanella dokdonensis]MBN7824663.1 polyphosphate kinase 2 [Bowmanella dokdonensis]
MKKQHYKEELKKLQEQLIQLQQWVVEHNKRLVVIFEGRDAAGKGGVIAAITKRLNPRIVRIAALGKPSDKESRQWYFQRYVEQLPAGGEIVLFDRSWYNRAGVEKVMEFCTQEQHREFLRTCPEFERMLIRADIMLVKYWFNISAGVQEKRFQSRLSNPLKRWKFSRMDLISRSRWRQYSQARNEMFEHTDTDDCPWYVVEANHKRPARLNCIHHLLSLIPYEEVPFDRVELPAIDQTKGDIPIPDNVCRVPQQYGHKD